MIFPYITIGGIGSRLKTISPLDKHELYYQEKKIIEWILDIVPNAIIIGKEKTNNRKETLEQIPHKDNVLIIDCDIIPFNFNINQISEDQDSVFVFSSNKKKYGSVLLDKNNQIIKSSENDNISNIKCSGIYYIKNLEPTLNKMKGPNSIISGMIGAKAIYENSFIKLGDIEDYIEAIGLER